MKYSVDTSSLINAWNRQYPPDMFAPVWELIDTLIDDGYLRASEEVLHEIKKKDDRLLEWAQQRPRLFIETGEAIQREVRVVLSTHKKLVDTRATRSAADPFVIGLAKANGAAVVTGEKRTNSVKRPHIPDVCDAYGINCCNLLDMLRSEGFSLNGPRES